MPQLFRKKYVYAPQHLMAGPAGIQRRRAKQHSRSARISSPDLTPKVTKSIKPHSIEIAFVTFRPIAASSGHSLCEKLLNSHSWILFYCRVTLIINNMSVGCIHNNLMIDFYVWWGRNGAQVLQWIRHLVSAPRLECDVVQLHNLRWHRGSEGVIGISYILI